MTGNETTTCSVRDAVFAIMRDFGANTIFGNPGSTELPMFRDFPSDFTYVLGLQEAAVVGMADGHAQAGGKVAFVNLHSAAGVGNAMGNIYTAFKNRTPMVIIAGQQARDILAFDPYLASNEATELPKPYVKWSIEPASAQQVPISIANACHLALQHPCGPVFISVPSDDWDQPAEFVPHRSVSRSVRPDSEALGKVADALCTSRRPAFVLGAEIDRDGAWEQAIALAERHEAAVFAAPMAARCAFPEDHRLFQGFLPAARAEIVRLLGDYDFVLVAGAPVFTYHVTGIGPHIAPDTILCQLTEDAHAAARAPVGTAVTGSVRLALGEILEHGVEVERTRPCPRPVPMAADDRAPLDVEFVLQTLDGLREAGDIVVEEAPTARLAMHRSLPMREPGSFYTMSSGGLGFGMPAAAGIALAQPDRRVICLIGDGSSMYSIQTLWTAVQFNLDITYVVLNNSRYGAMKRFGKVLGFADGAVLPGTDLPGLDFVALAQGHGCRAKRVDAAATLYESFCEALKPGPSLVEVIIA